MFEAADKIHAGGAAKRRQEIADAIEKIRGNPEREAEENRALSQGRIGELADRVVGATSIDAWV